MKFKGIGALLFILLFYASANAVQEFSQLPGVIHVHTTFSSGQHSIEELVSKAKEKGLEVLVLTDHDLVVMEYGIFPFRNIIKKRKEMRSVLKLGVDQYLSEINRVNRGQKEVLVIPGIQSSPFYYWTGSPFGEGLTAHNYQKELLLIGMQATEDYLELPLLHRGFSTRYFNELFPQALFFLGALLLAVYLLFQRGIFRVAGVLIGLLSIAFLINDHPLQSSRFDPYHGDQGIEPFQELIDHARQRNGLTFWAHPESNYSKNGVQLGPIKMVTGHYSEDLISSKGYTGFSAIYGDTITITKPGALWDQILNEFCDGKRSSPVWGIAGADFHAEKNGIDLDTFQTIFWAKDKSAAAVLSALESGKVYAVQKSGNYRLSLDRFEAIDQGTGKKARMGDEIDATGPLLIISGRVSASDRESYPVKVVLIRGGEVWESFEGMTPLEFHFVEKDQWNGKIFYRLEVRGPASHWLLSNPIFVSR